MLLQSAPAPSCVEQLFTLSLISMLTLGIYYALDNPAALSAHFVALAGGSTLRYETLYALYALPNLALPLLLGTLTDQLLDLHTSAVGLTAVVLLGQSTVATGVYFASFDIVASGRLIMGLGGETLSALQPALCAWWFEPHRRPAAMATAITLGGIGAPLNFLLTPAVAGAGGFTCATSVSALMCAASLVAAATITCRAHHRRVAVVDGPDVNLLERQDSDSDVGGGKSQVQLLRGLADLPAIALYTVNIFAYGPFYTFPSVARAFLHERCGHSIVPSDSAMLGLYYLTPILLGGPLGIALGGASVRCLQRWLLFACLMMATGFFVVAAAPAVHPLTGLLVIGAAYTLLCSTLPPALASRFPHAMHGQVFGMWACTQNLSNIVAPMCAGLLADRYSVGAIVVFFAGCCVGAACFAGTLLFLTTERRHISETHVIS